MDGLTVRFVRLVACLFLVAACGPTATAISTPTPDTAGPPLPSGLFTAPPPPTVSVPPDSRWQLLSNFPAQNAYEIVSMVNIGSGFVATGAAPAPGESYGGRSQGLIWTSADGQTWNATADPALLYTEPLQLAVLGSDQYLIGDYEPCAVSDQTCTDLDKSGYALFRAPAGGSWSMVSGSAGFQTGIVDGMIAGHGQLLVYGGADDDAETTTLWRSSDGTNWSSVGDATLEQITAMAATPSGFVMFAATFNGSSAVGGLVARSSVDGINFSPLTMPDLSAVGYPEIDGVAAKGSSLVAVGFGGDAQGNDEGLALFSPDGTNWSVAHDSDGSFAGSDLVDAVAIDNGYLAFGYATGDSGNLTARVWFSADGQSWRALADIPGSFTDVNAWGASSQAAIYFTDIENDISAENVVITVYPWYAPLGSLLSP
jgi:hypothetical protein